MKMTEIKKESIQLMILKRIFTLTIIIFCGILLCDFSVIAAKKDKITTKERNSYLSQSGFIGSSIGVGQKMYFNSKGKGYLGGPLMMVRGCYSFNNDSCSNHPYMIQYKGVPMKAKYAIKKSGIKRVFICMGTNDMYSSAESTFNSYKSYLQGIRKENPKVVIFIEAMPPIRGERSVLNNRNVNSLNKKLSVYCKKTKDMYYIDINSVLKGSDGRLKSNYCNDGYCHLSFAGYAAWTKKLCTELDKVLLMEKRAGNAVKKAEKTKQKVDVDAAKKLVKKLEKSTVKDKLNKRVKKIKVVKPEDDKVDEIQNSVFIKTCTIVA